MRLLVCQQMLETGKVYEKGKRKGEPILRKCGNIEQVAQEESIVGWKCKECKKGKRVIVEEQQPTGKTSRAKKRERRLPVGMR